MVHLLELAGRFCKRLLSFGSIMHWSFSCEAFVESRRFAEIIFRRTLGVFYGIAPEVLQTPPHVNLFVVCVLTQLI